MKRHVGLFVRWVEFDLTKSIAKADRLAAMTKKITYASFRSRLIAGFLLLVALLAALLFWKISSAYDAERAAAFSQTKSFAQAMSAHVASEMRSVDLSLIRAAEALGSLDGAALANVSRVRQVLALSASVSDAHFWINFVDTRGFGVAASNNLRIAGVSYADRSYFKVSAAGCDSGLIIGGPEMGRKSKGRTLRERVPTAATPRLIAEFRKQYAPTRGRNTWSSKKTGRRRVSRRRPAYSEKSHGGPPSINTCCPTANG